MSTTPTGRAFRLLWLGQTASAIGAGVTSVALPLVAVAVLDSSVVSVGVLGAVVWLPWLVVGLPAGAWVDRLSRRRVMIWCDVVSLVALATVPVAASLGVLTLAQLYIVGLVTGTAKVFFVTAYRALLPAIVAERSLLDANARLQGSESAALTAGPGLGGVLVQLAGAANAVLADVVSFAVSLGCLRAIHEPVRGSVGARRPLRREIADGLRFVWRDRLLRLFAGFGALANFTLVGYGTVSIVFLVDGVGLSAGVAGLLLAAGGVGGVAGAFLAPRLARRFGTGRAVLLCMVAGPPATLVIPLVAHDWRVLLFLLGELALTAGVGAGNVIRSGFVQTYCPPELLGRVTTTQQLANYGSIPAGALLGGVMADSLGYRAALWILFGTLVAASSLLLVSPLRGLRDLPTRETELSDRAGSIASRE